MQVANTGSQHQRFRGRIQIRFFCVTNFSRVEIKTLKIREITLVTGCVDILDSTNNGAFL